MTTRDPVGPTPEEPIDRIISPLARFLHVEAAGGAVLLIASVIALVFANSGFSEGYLAIWKTHFQFAIGGFSMDHSLKHWINDGLMAIFFFIVGLEVKRELVLGELRDMKRAALPIAAALGGMLVPAGLYLALQVRLRHHRCARSLCSVGFTTGTSGQPEVTGRSCGFESMGET